MRRLRSIAVALVLVLLSAAPSQAAIAFVNAGDGGNNGGGSTSRTFSVTVNAGESLIVVFAGDTSGGADDVSSVVWNGSEALSLLKKNVSVADRFLYSYGIFSPTPTTANVVVTVGSTHYILAGWATYTGMNTSGQPDASIAVTNGGDPGPYSTTLTTVTDNSWTLLLTGHNFSGHPDEAGSGSSRRAYDVQFGTWTLFDSNAAITPAGSTTMNFSQTGGSSGVRSVMLSLAPSGGGGGGGSTPAPRLTLLGAGPGQ